MSNMSPALSSQLGFDIHGRATNQKKKRLAPVGMQTQQAGHMQAEIIHPAGMQRKGHKLARATSPHSCGYALSGGAASTCAHPKRGGSRLY